MKILYARQPISATGGKSLFLAGPTPRTVEVPSWRPDAIIRLGILGFEGTIFVPEDEDGKWEESVNYGLQVDWEYEALQAATCIMFWIPRDLITLPGYTTNIEFGRFLDSGKVVLGAPPGTPKMRNLWYHAEKLGIPTATTLLKTIHHALDMIEAKT